MNQPIDPSQPKSKPANIALSDAHVLSFLSDNPDFFHRHPELLASIDLPERGLGDGVVDFQAYQLKNLKNNSKDLEQKHQALVDFCRSHLSAQAEIYEAVMRMIKAKNLDQLLEVIAVDMPALFDLDVVRLIVEAPTAEYLNDNMDVWQQSGVMLVPTGVISSVLGFERLSLIEDVQQEPNPALEDVFAGAVGLSRSAAMLTLDCEEVDLSLMLAMGARSIGRFSPAQGTQPLLFLAQVMSVFLERYLSDLGA